MRSTALHEEAIASMRDAVQKVVVTVGAREASVVNARELADISLQHLLAVMLVDGTVTFKSTHDASRMRDPAVLRQRAKISLVGDVELEKLLPRRVGIVEVTLADGRVVSERVETVRGTTGNPMTREEDHRQGPRSDGPNSRCSEVRAAHGQDLRAGNGEIPRGAQAAAAKSLGQILFKRLARYSDAMNVQAPKDRIEARAELDAILAANPKIEFVDAAIADICGTLRGKRLPVADALKLFESGMQIPQSLHLMDVRGEMMNPSGRGYTDGDPDGTAWPIPGTVMEIWGADPPRAQMLTSLARHQRCRALLRSARGARSRARALRRASAHPVCAHELEFYLVDEKRDDRGHPLPPRSPRTGERETTPSVYGLEDLDDYQAFLTALNDAAALQRVPISATSKEYAPGQFEANLRHQANALHGVRPCDLPAPDREGRRREPGPTGDLHGQALSPSARARASTCI